MLQPAMSLRRNRSPQHSFIGTCLQPKSTYTTFMDEGFIHYRSGHYRKALNCFDRAVELKPGDKKALVSRSECHLKLGDAPSALADAEASFDSNSKTKSIRGLYQYSEALFNLGKFERALIAYYRGFRLRRHLDIFRIGVQKCRAAILGAIGNHASTQMEDLEEILPLITEFEYLRSNQMPHCCIRPELGESKEYHRRPSILKEPSKARATWVSREILGELNLDKGYLKKFMTRYNVDKSEHSWTSKMLTTQTSEALNYLAIREDFWGQMQPMYTKKPGLNFNNKMVTQYEVVEKERQEANRRIHMDAVEGALMKNIRTIQHDVSIKRPKDSLLECIRTLRQIKHISLRLLPKKREYLCFLYHYKGLSQMMLKKFEPALKSFQKELELAVDQPMEAIKSRALDCMGKAFVKKRMYLEAIDAWETRMSIIKLPLERACMLHELAHCYYVLKKPSIAESYVEMAIKEASKIDDWIWLMNSYFFLAKLQVEQHRIDLAYITMEKAASAASHIKNKALAKKVKQCVYCLNAWCRKTELDEDEKIKAIRMLQAGQIPTETLDVPEEYDEEPEIEIQSVLLPKKFNTTSTVYSSSAASRGASHVKIKKSRIRFRRH